MHAAGLRAAAPNAISMAGRGETLSMFVVQRTFKTVRRGYDPEEVDRHLELVSRWFTSTDAGKAIAEERARLKEREAEAEHVVEGARIEAEATLEGARRRAEADTREAERRLAEAGDALDAARIEAAAADAVREAQKQAERIVADARAEAERELETARRAGEQLLAAVRAEAAEAADRLRAEAEEELRAYVERRRREADRIARRERG